jgi:hypothetical protein
MADINPGVRVKDPHLNSAVWLIDFKRPSVAQPYRPLRRRPLTFRLRVTRRACFIRTTYLAITSIYWGDLKKRKFTHVCSPFGRYAGALQLSQYQLLSYPR